MNAVDAIDVAAEDDDDDEREDVVVVLVVKEIGVRRFEDLRLSFSFSGFHIDLYQDNGK